MSNRERWIVYPLLLFTIVSTVFDRIRDRSFVHFDTVHCHELVVASPQGSPRIVLNQSPESRGGLLTIHGPTAGAADGKITHGKITHRNEVQTEIGAGKDGGFLRIAGVDGVPTLYLGHVNDRQLSGLVATDQLGSLLEADGGVAEGSDPTTTDGNVSTPHQPWGTTLAWEKVPNSQRDFEATKASLLK